MISSLRSSLQSILFVCVFTEQCPCLISSFKIILTWSGVAWKLLPSFLQYTLSPFRSAPIPTSGVISWNQEYQIPSFDTICVTSCSLPIYPGFFSRVIIINWKAWEAAAESPGVKLLAQACLGTGNISWTFSDCEIIPRFAVNFLKFSFLMSAISP